MAAPAEPPSTFKTVHVAGSCLLILVGAGLAACGTYQSVIGSATPLLPFFCSSFPPFLLSSFSSFLCCRILVRLLVYLLPIKGKTTPHATRSTPSCPQSTPHVVHTPGAGMGTASGGAPDTSSREGMWYEASWQENLGWSTHTRCTVATAGEGCAEITRGVSLQHARWSTK
jgi:hypothetical protein